MKKVIMLATYFPPAGGISTFRITKFVKYLADFGWEPVVLTVEEAFYKECNFPIDSSLLKDIPEKLSIYRTRIGKEPLVLKGLRKGLPTRWLRHLYFAIGPIVKKEKPSLLFASGDPFFPLLIAPVAKYFFKLKYVIDLRDPWKLAIVDSPSKGLKGRISQPINNFLEPIVLNNASKIIVVSDKMAQEYREAYPKRRPEDFIVIPNGFDPNDYEIITPKSFSEFTITYAGKFLTGKSFRNPEFFFRALKILKLKGIPVNFKYIGEKNDIINKMVADIGLTDQFESVGYLSYRDTISYMKGSNILLLIGSGQETEQTGKIFDYLGCQRPILALASKKGGIADVVGNLEQITLIENEKENIIAEAILEFYKNQTSIPIERKGISQYQRKTLTSELAKVFDQIVNDPIK